MVAPSQALTLISRLEEHKLEQVEELRRRTEQGKDCIRQAKLAMDKTWWDHLVDYVSSRNTGSGQMAVSTAPFFQEVPDKALQGILPPQGVDAEPFSLSKGHSHTSTGGGGGRHCISPRIGLSTCLPVPNPTNH